METRTWGYEEFPEYEGLPDGARVLATTGDEPGSRYVPDVPYLRRGDHELRLQLLIPTCRNSLNATAAGERPTYPCLVYVQGSAWRKQDCYKNMPQLARIAERGIVVAVVEYRDSSMACFPAQVHDAQAAVRFVADHADELSVDPGKIVIGGSSSGGHTAVLATLLPDENGSPAADLPVRGVLDFYGAVSFLREDGYPTTLDAGSLTSPEGALAGGSLRENPRASSSYLCRHLSIAGDIDASRAYRSRYEGPHGQLRGVDRFLRSASSSGAQGRARAHQGRRSRWLRVLRP